MFIAVDFDGTCVTHRFPEVGKEIGAAEALRILASEGHQLILCTMRAHVSERQYSPEIEKLGFVPTKRDTLQEAVDWFNKNGIPLYGINDNPSQHTWTTSPKIYAHIYIDDAALGIPLIYTKTERPYVDWKKVMKYFYDRMLISQEGYEAYKKTLKK